MLDTIINKTKLWGIKFQEKQVSNDANLANYEMHSNNLHNNK
jgi:hypothetical protein